MIHKKTDSCENGGGGQYPRNIGDISRIIELKI